MKTNAPRVILSGIIAISIALAVSTTAGAQNEPRPLPVEVKNTAPISVTGTVNVASSPSAPLSVNGNVNVSGQVTVTNAATSPLTVRDLNSLVKKPIQLSGSCSTSNTPLDCSLVNYTVPNGKLLVIEYVSTRYAGPTGSRGKVVILTCMQEYSYLCISSTGGPHPTTVDRRAEHYLDPTGVMSSGVWSFAYNHVATSQKVLIFGNDKASISIYGHCNPGLNCGDSFSIDVTVSGYLIDNP
jgi:hypothetical protein